METIKTVIVGDPGIGKTSLLLTHEYGTFPSDFCPSVADCTNGINSMFNGIPINHCIWDTAGQEDYDRLRPLAYPQTQVFLLAFSIGNSVGNESSFQNVITKWLPEITHNCPGVPFILVGTKNDIRGKCRYILDNMGVVKEEEAVQRAEEIGAVKYLECSALDGRGVDKVFNEAIGVAMNTPIRNC